MGEDTEGTEKGRMTWLLSFLCPPISHQSLCFSNPARSEMTWKLVKENFLGQCPPPSMTEEVRVKTRKGSESIQTWAKHKLTDKVGVALGAHRASLSTSLPATGLPPLQEPFKNPLLRGTLWDILAMSYLTLYVQLLQ